MKWILKGSATIQEIQNDFRQIFSHLKIEFYNAPHSSAEGSSQKEQYLHNIRLADILGHSADIELELNPKMSTGDFERMLEDSYHLHSQIFRLQRGTWLQTTLSDAMSLESQNRKGIDADSNSEPITASDFDLE
jgi:hypothetical protein